MCKRLFVGFVSLQLVGMPTAGGAAHICHTLRPLLYTQAYMLSVAQVLAATKAAVTELAAFYRQPPPALPPAMPPGDVRLPVCAAAASWLMPWWPYV